MKRLPEVFVLSVLGLLLFASQGSGQSGLVPYTPTSPWNTPIPANPFVSPKSSGYISGLTGSFGSDPTQYSFPVYKVDSATPLRTVSISGSFKTWGCNTCQATVQSGGTVRVPIPSGAQAAAGTDGQIILWNASTGQLVLYLRGHTKPLTGATFSASGTWIATGSDDGTARTFLCDVCRNLSGLQQLARERLAAIR